ncbi:Transcriptional regulator ATRX homolog [Anthophora quadrimaculata]
MNMSSFSKLSNRRTFNTNDEYGSISARHRIAKLRKVQEKINSLCDNESSSSEEIRPFFMQKSTNSSSSSVCKSSDENRTKSRRKSTSSVNIEESEDDYDKQKSNKELSKSDKHKSNTKSRKVAPNDVRKERYKNRETDSSDLEDLSLSKFAQKKEKRHLTVKSHHKGFTNLHKEDVDSSSSKEFQKTKVFRSKENIKKTLIHPKEPAESNLEFTTETENEIIINEEQSLYFKSRVMQIFSKLKKICSDYQLQVSQLQLVYPKSACKVINKSKNVINDLKMELHAQEEELTNFYEEWCKNNNLKNTDFDDKSLTENEASQNAENKEESNVSKSNSKAVSMVSECDDEEIFFENEIIPMETNTDENEKNEDSVDVKELEQLINNSEEGYASPIIGSIGKEKKKSTQISKEDNSEVIIESGKISKECQRIESEYIANESTEDIFNDTIYENVDDINKEDANKYENEDNPKSEENSSENNNLNKELNDKDVPDKLVPCEEMLDSIEKEINDLNDEEFDDEEQAKKAMLESDSETPINEDSPVEKYDAELANDNLKDKDVSKRNRKTKNNNTKSCSIDKSSSSDEQDKIIEMEDFLKSTLLDSNSDNSMSPCNIKESSNAKHDSDDNNEDTRAKVKLLVSSNSESSSSDNSSKLQGINANFSSEKDKENSLVHKKTNCKERAHSLKINYTGSDKKLKMLSQIVVEKLSDEVLEKYKDVLNKSRQYLECKEIKSLIDLDRLQKNHKSMSDSTRNLRKKKTSAVREEEDSLLNHLMKVENTEFVEHSGEDSNSANDNRTAEIQASFQTNDELIAEADAVTKNILLCSSDSDIGEQKVVSESNDSEEEKSKTKLKDPSKKSTENEKNKDSDKEDEEEKEKNRWRRDKILTSTFSSDSDTEVKMEKWNAKQNDLRKKAEEDDTNLSDKEEVIKRKRNIRKKIILSDSDTELFKANSDTNSSVIPENNKSSDSDFSVGKQKRIHKRKGRRSSDTDSSFAEKRAKPKRRRIKKVSSDSDDNSDNDQTTNSQGTPGKTRRKNIRKVMKDKQVADDTKQAAKEEEERLKRIAERQKLYNEMYEARLAGEEKLEKLVLDFNPETKEELVVVHENLVKRLKPHQAKGIKFMWDACFESLERIKSSNGSGCIIAHCMGLGKTLQVIALAHTLLMHEETGVKTIMIVCPLSTVLNWFNEFSLWLKNIDDDIEIYEMTKFKKNLERKYQLETWQRTGGILIIGYEMFRNLSGTNNRMKKNMKEAVLRYLIDPGPDVIVCDEGHLLKNEDTALSKSIKRIRTLRRIVLTGTPLQNNLIEYHCMVQFVKPNLLGTKKEFLNRFANPITNGQFDDSTEYDVKLMKKRAYVLHKMLKGCVQRFDYSVLTPFLPPKQEYVIFVSLAEVQMKLYRYYLENFARRTRSAGGSIFTDFQALQRIWTHPMLLRLNAEKMERMNEKKASTSDSDGSLRDFIDDNDTESTSSRSSSSSSSSTHSDADDEIQNIDSDGTVRNTRNSSKNNEPVSKHEEQEKKGEEWWLQFVQPEHFEDMKVSSKLVLLFGILKECEQLGDKVLVFSQSLYSLTLIEQFLAKIDKETQENTNSENINGHTGSWSLGLDYFRLDGQTSAENRNIWCKIFNRPSNIRARLFLISTRAGGLGINLTAANRVIIFDASWNPSHDVQSIFRVYRFGQKKPCYVYRFLAAGTMEEKIYNRQVTKLSLSCRVVDVQQIERHYSNHSLSELYSFEPNTSGQKPTLNLPKDRLLAEIFLKYKDYVENYHEHDSLLENKAEEELNEEERKQAWLEYEEEKKGKPVAMPSYSAMAALPNELWLNQYKLPQSFINTDYENLHELLRKDFPNTTPEAQQILTARALTDMYSYWERQAYHNSTNRIVDQNPNVKAMPIGMHVPNMVRMNQNNMVQNTYKNVTSQVRDNRSIDVRTVDADDDVVEVPSTTVNNKNKNQEE